MTLRVDSVEPRRSILEYAEAIRRRYLGASKKIKTKILDEFVAATGFKQVDVKIYVLYFYSDGSL